MKKREVDKRFIAAMENKLEKGRCAGKIGWDENWKNVKFPIATKGQQGYLMGRLQGEVTSLVIAVHENNINKILSESADIANFAMMIADTYGAMDETL